MNRFTERAMGACLVVLCFSAGVASARIWNQSYVLNSGVHSGADPGADPEEESVVVVSEQVSVVGANWMRLHFTNYYLRPCHPWMKKHAWYWSSFNRGKKQWRNP